MHAHENSAKNQRKHSKQNKTNWKALTPGQILRQVWPINLPETRNKTRREKNFNYKQVNYFHPFMPANLTKFSKASKIAQFTELMFFAKMCFRQYTLCTVF
jgi:hypothetical protein